MHDAISLGNATSATIIGHTSPAEAIENIRAGKWADQIAALRSATGDERAQRKKLLPAFLWAGKFTARNKTGIETFSGLLCADIDDIPDRVGELHDTARQDPHAAAAFVSPSGTGIKIVFRVPVATDAKQHQQNFDAVRAHVALIYAAKVDEAAKDVARLCFVSHDPTAFYNAEAVPLDVQSELSPVASVAPHNGVEINGHRPAASTRAQIAEDLLGPIHWTDERSFCRCPGQHLHTTVNADKDCMVMLTGAPTIKCLHASCSGIVAGVNHELRSRIAKAEYVPPSAHEPEPHWVDAAAEYLASAAEAEPAAPAVALPGLIDAADFLATPIDPPAELVTGILHKGSKLAFGGSSKSFKTWCLLDLALSVATGADWLGHRTAQGGVLFVNFEIQPHAWQRRIAAVSSAKDVELKPGLVQLWNLRGHAADFNIIVPRIIERCRQEQFALIVLDPIYKLYGNTDENSAGNVALLLNSLERLASETGAAIAFGAHFAKGNASQKEAIDRISGSGVFARDPDSLLIFTKHEEDDAFTVEPILRNFPPVRPFAVRWQFPLMRPADDLDPAKLKQVAGRKKEHDPAKFLAIIAQNDEQNPISVTKWALGGNVPRKTLESYLAEMRGKGWIKTIGEGTTARQYITNAGKAFLNGGQHGEN